MKTLDQIAIETGTDKNSKCHAYSQYYEMFFEPIRNKPLNVFEIGCYHGDSLRMWRKYFPNAMIYSADIEDMTKHNEERIKTFIMDQSKPLALTMFKAAYPFMDIIIDDASHQSEDQIRTFESLWSHLNSGGFYVCEDLLCSYFNQWAASGVRMTDRVKQMIDDVNMGGLVDQNYLCSNKKEERLRYNLDQFQLEIEFVFVSCGLVIIKKL